MYDWEGVRLGLGIQLQVGGARKIPHSQREASADSVRAVYLFVCLRRVHMQSVAH